MAYPPPPRDAESDAALRGFFESIGERKEFRSLLRPATAETGGEAAPPLSGLRLQGAQLFIKGFMSPSTPYTRLVLNWQTGMGKTIGAIAVAQEFIKTFQKLSAAERPTVLVVGFTKTIFVRTLITHPEFGYSTPAELARLALLEARASASEAAAKERAALLAAIRRRFEKKHGGFYSFIGYKELALKLFRLTEKGVKSKASLQDLYAGGAPDFDRAIEDGVVTANDEILQMLRGGLVVADEIHNTYNSLDKNNYGMALKYALNAAETPPTRALFMSATLMSGSAEEIVDLINILLPQQRASAEYRREDFFTRREAEGGRKEVRLRPGALERIGYLLAGRVSFAQIRPGSKDYPRRVFVGAELPDPLVPGHPMIPYLRFTPCPMAPFHEKTLHTLHRDGNTIPIPANAHSLYDIAYPNPEYPPRAADPDSAGFAAAVGLFKSTETPAAIGAAPPSWQKSAGARTLLEEGGEALTGAFLDPAPPDGAPLGLENYSTKYAKVCADVLKALTSGPGKILVYHDRVHMSGVLLLTEVLKAAGFVDGGTPATSRTRCGVCGRPKADHRGGEGSWHGPHPYQPARMLTVHSEISKKELEGRVREFNAPANAEGFGCRVLLGSKVIRESYDLQAVQHLLICSLPTDISTLLQVVGRAVRNKSHASLPEAQREVRIQIYVSTAGPFSRYQGVEPDVHRYATKMAAFQLIQTVEQRVRRFAVNGFLLEASDAPPSIDGLPVRPLLSSAEIRERPVVTDSFYAYGFGGREVALIKQVILALFHQKPVWGYQGLWAAVRAPRIENLHVDPASFGEDAFCLALHETCLYNPLHRLSPDVGHGLAPPFRIYCIKGFYVRADAADAPPVVDIESYARDRAAAAAVSIDVEKFLGETREASVRQVYREFSDRFSADPPPDIREAFRRYGKEFHFAVLQGTIEGLRGGTRPFARLLQEDFRRPAAPLRRLFALYSQYSVTFTRKDLSASGRAAAGRPDAVVGYHSTLSSRYYDAGRWYDIPLAAMGVGTRPENPTVVGFYDEMPGGVRFKLRFSAKRSQAGAPPADKRFKPRGAVCDTYEKRALTKALAKLGRKPTGKRPLTTAETCLEIEAALLAKELQARAPPKGMWSGVRWVYLFNENSSPLFEL